MVRIDKVALISIQMKAHSPSDDTLIDAPPETSDAETNKGSVCETGMKNLYHSSQYQSSYEHAHMQLCL